MPSDAYKNDDYMNDDDYRRIRDAEKEEYAYFDEEADGENEGSPEAAEQNPSGATYDPSTDFIVVLPKQFIRIPQDSNLAWMTMFYALPKELVSKRPEYLELPRHIVKLINSEKHMNLIKQDAFLELVWDCYAWGIWQALKVPDGKGGYKEIPGDWKNYSGDFPLWRMSYDILRYFRMIYETEMEWSFQRLFTMPENIDLSWMSWRHFCNLIFNLTDRISWKRKRCSPSLTPYGRTDSRGIIQVIT